MPLPSYLLECSLKFINNHERSKPSLADEKGLRLVEEPPNSERKGVPKPNSPEPDFGWHLITDGIDDLSPSSPVESSPIMSPSDTDDSDSEWKWRKCYGDEIDCQKLLVKWEAEMFRRKTRMWPELYFHNDIFESEINGAPEINLITCFAPYVVNGANCDMELFDGFLDYAPLKFLVFFIVILEQNLNYLYMNGSVEEDMNGLVEEDMNGSAEE
ncbi:hypothetical protein OROMI_011506 [Orobanche minor]